MQIINTDTYRKFNIAEYFDNYSACFIDIETTGLSRTYNHIYLIGIFYYDTLKNTWTITQILADDKDEEKLILNETIRYLEKYDRIITFNGDTFDIPFINQRLKILSIPYEIKIDRSFDIYKIVKENRYYLNLNSLNLKSLERFLGVFRDDIYTGKECIKFYQDYIRTKDIELKNNILKHNYDDLYYMIDIMKILDSIKEKKHLVISINENNIELVIDKVSIVGDMLYIMGYVKNDFHIELMYYNTDYNVLFDKKGIFEVKLECSLGLISPNTRGYFVDKNKIVLSKGIIDSTEFNLPSNILLIKVEKNFCIENIKNLLSKLIYHSLKENLR